MTKYLKANSVILLMLLFFILIVREIKSSAATVEALGSKCRLNHFSFLF